MYTGMLHMHRLVVILFLLIYLVKATLLVLNRKDSLQKFSATLKVPEMIISIAFLVTGIILAFNSGNLGPWFWVKMVAVATSIPLAIIAFKRMNKPMALMAVMFIVYAYGISETKSPSFKADDLSASYSAADPAQMGQSIYEGECLACHGAEGKGGASGAKDLTSSALTPDERLDIILNGKNAMMAYRDRLSPEQIDAVAGYVETLAAP